MIWSSSEATNSHSFLVLVKSSKLLYSIEDLIMIEAILLSDRDISAVNICEIVEDIEFRNWRKGNASKRWHR